MRNTVEVKQIKVLTTCTTMLKSCTTRGAQSISANGNREKNGWKKQKLF